MNLTSSKKVFLFVVIMSLLVCSTNLIVPANLPQQNLNVYDKERGKNMLLSLKEDLKKYYYDSTFHSMDVDTRFKAAEEKIQQATSNGQIFGIIAQTLMDLNDSHTFFLPPSRTAKVEYGWQVQMIGNKCYVVAVKPDSDGDKKGLRPGDEVETINGFAPSRQDLWKIQYTYNTLRPQPAVRFLVKRPDGEKAQIDVVSKITQGKAIQDLTDDEGLDFLQIIREQENNNQLNRHRFVDIGDITVWKMPQFDLSEQEVDKAMDIVKKSKGLIIDLRRNPGGLVSMLQRLVGSFFEQDIKIGELKGRKETKPLIAKSRGKKAYTGKVVVLIDSKSASCSEIFSRVMQLEKRGTIIGDTSSGSVMISRSYRHQLGMDVVVFYGASITQSDLIMTDGKSLEHIGITPNEIILPSASNLAAEKDPVLTRAAEILGKSISEEKAGQLFPIEWQK